jgi:hypothetical protein
MQVENNQQTIDFSALKFNQAAIIACTVLGFILHQPIVPTFVAGIMLAGSINKKFALFKLTYAYVFKPLGILKPNIIEGSPAPHEFAQFLGGTMLAIGSLFLFCGFTFPGWIFVWIVIVLAAANLFFGFCAGCFVYYQLGKHGVPGFRTHAQQE